MHLNQKILIGIKDTNRNKTVILSLTGMAQWPEKIQLDNSLANVLLTIGFNSLFELKFEHN